MARRCNAQAALLAVGYAALAAGAVGWWVARTAAVVDDAADLTRALVPLAAEARGDPLEAAGGAGFGRPYLLFVFSVRDCPAALEQARLWAELSAAGLVEAVGAAIDEPLPPDSQLPPAVEGLHAVVRAPPALLRRLPELGYRRTPVTLLLDAAARPRLVLPGLSDVARQREAAELVRRAAEFLAGTADPL